MSTRYQKNKERFQIKARERLVEYRKNYSKIQKIKTG